MSGPRVVVARQSVLMVWHTTIAATCILGATASVAGDELTVMGAHLATYHDSGPYENFNPGLYVAHRNWTAGFYHNSTRRTSIYGGYTWSWHTNFVPGVDSYALTAAVANGYPNTIRNTDLSVLLIPSVGVPLAPSLRLRVTFLPFVPKYNPATSLHFSVERAF